MKHRYLFSFFIIFFCFTFNFTSYAGVLSQRRKVRENKTTVDTSKKGSVKQSDQYITKISGNGVQELKRPVSPLAQAETPPISESISQPSIPLPPPPPMPTPRKTVIPKETKNFERKASLADLIEDDVNATADEKQQFEMLDKKIEDKKDTENQEQKTESLEKKALSTNDDDTIEFYFEDTDLQNVVTQIGQLYDVTFIPDDVINPIAEAEGGKSLKGNKLSFKTHKPLTRKEGWSLFITFLDIADFALIPAPEPRMFRIIKRDKAKRAAVPTYIGVNPDTLPDSDQIIRFVYFIENIVPETLKQIIDPMLSTAAGPALVLRDLKALILTDKSYNIKMLMKIIKELDKGSMPQALSVLKLTRADAKEVEELYKKITQTEDQNAMTRFMPARKQPTSLYFPENVKIISEPRTNSLILLGARDAIEKVENFVRSHIDVEPDKPYSPLHTYQVKFADAVTLAQIMNELRDFGKTTKAGEVGGVRGGDKYFRNISFIAEPATNQLIIRGDYEDYLKAIDVIKQLDEPQPQIAIEVLILTVELRGSKEIGAQIRSKESCASAFGQNVEFQAANLGSIETQPNGTSPIPGCKRLLGNLLKVVQGSAGNTAISLGCDALGVWGVLKMLETVANSEVISNPFLLATNKQEAKVSVGETLRLQTSTIVGQTPVNTFGDEDAKLTIIITPQINSDGMIILDINIESLQFLEGTGGANAARSIRKIDTKTIVADNEVVALGGLIRNRLVDNMVKTPLLGDIPIVGWLFKDRTKRETKDNLLVLFSAKIIEPGSVEGMKRYTDRHIDEYYDTLDQIYSLGQDKDPIHRLFFQTQKDVAYKVDNLLFDKEQRKPLTSHQKRKEKKVRQSKTTEPAKTEPAKISESSKQKPNTINEPVTKNIPTQDKLVENVKEDLSQSDQLMKKLRARPRVSLTDFVDECGELVT